MRACIWQLALFYEDTAHAFAEPPLLGHLPDAWASIVSWNHKMYTALAHYHLASEHAAAYEYGMQVCHHAQPTMSTAHART